MPYKLVFQLVKDLDLQAELNKNPHKEIKNLLGQFVPKSFAEFVLENLDIELVSLLHLNVYRIPLQDRYWNWCNRWLHQNVCIRKAKENKRKGRNNHGEGWLVSYLRLSF